MLHSALKDCLHVLNAGFKQHPTMWRRWCRSKKETKCSNQLFSVVTTANCKEDSVEVGMMPSRAKEVREVKI